MASPPPAKQSPPLPPPQQRPLPAHPLQWSVDDVGRWALAHPHVAPVAMVLREHAVDGHVLVNYVSNSVLAEELGISAFGTRIRVLEAVEALRWSLGITTGPRRPPAPRSSAERSQSSPRSASSSPETDRGQSSREGSPGDDSDGEDSDGAPLHRSKRSASRIADAEKKRQKRADLKKNPVLYAEYLQKERERNARRRARLRAERGRSDSSGAANDARPLDHAPGASSPNDYTHATAAAAYAPFAAAADPPAKPAVLIGHPLQPPPHNLRRGPAAPAARAPAPERRDAPPAHAA
ncbi:hypothetical protein IWQ57_003255 [Coemansia nantahalensis]|uniref:Uncharacterized protein n=2 Tax=Coemansia TaxID=4863 RepID=A0ACC1KZB3_9FUNG|nr:hypothetical protein IWQ57_003255 [Coemansia nantahalensis]KAJ2798076.1 hypothetical protein H4R21_004074 [Coemansia helicoidea]